ATTAATTTAAGLATAARLAEAAGAAAIGLAEEVVIVVIVRARLRQHNRGQHLLSDLHLAVDEFAEGAIGHAEADVDLLQFLLRRVRGPNRATGDALLHFGVELVDLVRRIQIHRFSSVGLRAPGIAGAIAAVARATLTATTAAAATRVAVAE